MKNNSNNKNKVNRKIKQINKLKSFKKTISKYVPLSSIIYRVTIIICIYKWS